MSGLRMLRQGTFWGWIVLAGLAGLGAEPLKSEIRYDHDSQYYRIVVMDYPTLDRRTLMFSKTRGAQSSMILSKPQALGLAYLRTLMASVSVVAVPKRVLVVGLGGGAIPKFFAQQFPEVQVDVVEIDPDVVKVAQQFFSFRPSPKTKIFTMDGRLFLKENKEKYDLIVVDAYASDRIPFHLTTMEFFALVKQNLNPDGVMALNLWEYLVNRYFVSELKTVQSTFPQSYLFTTTDPASKVVFATMRAQPVSKEVWAANAAKLPNAAAFGYNLTELIRREYESITDKVYGEKPLTDDMAPVDQLRTVKEKS